MLTAAQSMSPERTDSMDNSSNSPIHSPVSGCENAVSRHLHTLKPEHSKNRAAAVSSERWPCAGAAQQLRPGAKRGGGCRPEARAGSNAWLLGSILQAWQREKSSPKGLRELLSSSLR